MSFGGLLDQKIGMQVAKSEMLDHLARLMIALPALAGKNLLMELNQPPIRPL
jgi:hypothetical protein